jgi:hypothetical protein
MWAKHAPTQSLSDSIAADMESQAKAESRPSPVVLSSENDQLWVGGGGGDHDTGGGILPPSIVPDTGPLPVLPGIGLLRAMAPPPAPPPASIAAPPTEAPTASVGSVAPAPTRTETSPGNSPGSAARTVTLDSADAEDRRQAATHRPAPRVSSVASQMARIAYGRGSRDARLFGRAVARHGDPRAL